MLYIVIENKNKEEKMKLCLACFKKCEDSAQSCDRCGYGSESFVHSSLALPINTTVGNKYITGKAEFADENTLSYLVFDTETKKVFRMLEYYPKSLVLRRSGNKLVFKNIGASAGIDNSKADGEVDFFEENGTHYRIFEIPSVKSSPQKTPSKKPSAVFRNIVYIASIICLVISVGYLVNFYVIEPWRHSNQTANLSGMLETTAESLSGADPLEQVKKDYPDVDFPEGMNPAFALLYSQNPETAGWVSIGGTDINYAVMQSDNNDKYLKTDFFGKSTNYGQPYFDYRNDIKNLDRNTIIHGHNMRHDDKIFGVLEQYRKPEAFISSPIIEMKTIYGNYKFKIYAVFIVNSDKEQDNGNRFYYNFTQATDAEFEEYVNELDKRKLYSTGVDICPQDKILTLSTCCYDFYDARLAVIGRLVRDGESPEVDTSLVKINENPKFPQAYYDAQRRENPYKNDDNAFSAN